MDFRATQLCPEALRDGHSEDVGKLVDFVSRGKCALPREDRDARACVEHGGSGVKLIQWGADKGGLQDVDDRAPGFRIDRLSADSFIHCTSY